MGDLKQDYGEEYPAAVVCEGLRMPLLKNGRFLREYESEDHSHGCWISRFMDQSASITLDQLECEWPEWNEAERMEFCNACPWLNGQPDFPEMVRFIMQHGSPREWCAIALSVASCLPQIEAYDILVRALRSADIGKGSNLVQAIAHTKHAEAEQTLRHYLKSVWEHESLWDTSESVNWVAVDASNCIAHLIKLGAPPTDFEDQVRQLSEHVCAHNRESCHNHLAQYYPWLT